MPNIVDKMLSTRAYDSVYNYALDREYGEVADETQSYGEAITAAHDDGKYEEAEIIKSKMIASDASDVQFFVDLLNGRKPIGAKVPKIKDAVHDLISHKDFPFIFEPAIEIVMKDYVMPQTPVTSEIFQTIPYHGQKDQVNIKTVGPIQIEEVGDNEPYPEVGGSVTDNAYRMALDIKKYGAKLAMTQELADSDNWGILGLLFSQIMDGFILHQEYMGMKLLNKLGTTIFNNAIPAAGLEGRITEGRGIDGNPNGTLSLNDLMTMYTYGNTRGFNYSVLLMHPFAWQMFATNAELREVVVQGSTVQSALNSTKLQGAQAPGFGSPFGEQFGYLMKGIGGQNAAAAQYSPNAAIDPWLGKLGISPAASTLTPWGSTFNIPPASGLWPGGLRVIVTPYVPWHQDPTSKKYVTNLYFVDPQRTGIILQGEGPTVDEWSDIDREIRYMKFKRKFGMQAVHGGRGVAVARNLVIDRSYVFDNVNSRSLSPITTGSTVGGVAFP